MTNCLARLLPKSLAVLLILFSIAACNGGTSSFPAIANPPPFDYVDGQELRSRMHRLAFELQKLDLSLVSTADSEEDSEVNSQRQIIASLENIERISNELSGEDISNTHTFLQNDMRRFLDSVTKARRDADRNPPQYSSAGRVAGSCVICHSIQ